MNRIKNAITKAEAAIAVGVGIFASKLLTPIRNNNGNELTEKLGLIIGALVVLALFLVSMKTITTTNMATVSTKMAALFN